MNIDRANTPMTDLPVSSKLPIERLAACFNNVTNSYKFYWFLSILEGIKEGQGPIIPVKSLLANMVASVWYPTNYFRLSFGRQDRLGSIALKIQAESRLPIDTKKSDAANEVLAHLSANSEISREIMSLARFVPYRFLRPFFSDELKGKPDWKVDRLIAEFSENSFEDEVEPCLYRFTNEAEGSIEIQRDWFDYLQEHIHILTGFCLWHLLNYLQRNNPNVPNIAGKLFEPEKRDLKQARHFWQLVFDKLGSIRCIYSDQMMHKNDSSLDHFLPWRFVAHDLLWNIIPTPPNVNSAKSDSLPNLQLYFDSFARLQHRSLQIVAESSKAKLLEDYTMLFKVDEVADIKSLPFERFRDTLQDAIVPQVQIAKNMGFTVNWSYSAT